jgi:SM-20-related protein
MIDELAEKSWTVQNNWLPPEQAKELRLWAERARAEGRFRPAGIGAHGERQEKIRGDRILWVTPDLSPLLHGIWQKYEDLRVGLNRELYLGLDHFELHLAVYEPGEFYQAHLDQQRQGTVLSGSRLISSVLYLNPDWTAEDEGELLILDPSEPSRVREKIAPLGGRLLLFRSDTVLHEVRAPRRERWSLTGWFRRR